MSKRSGSLRFFLMLSSVTELNQKQTLTMHAVRQRVFNKTRINQIRFESEWINIIQTESDLTDKIGLKKPKIPSENCQVMSHI